MSKRKGLPFIPLQMPDMDAAFAGKQFQIEAAHNRTCEDSKMYPIFRDTIYRLIFANFKWEGDITPVEAAMIERQLITTGRIVAVRSTLNVNGKQPEGVYYGYLGMGEGNITNPIDINKPTEFQETFDFYGQSSMVSCSGLNGTMFTAYNENNYVIGYDTTAVNIISPMITSPISYLDILAHEIDKAYRAWRIAVETNKLGMVFSTPDRAVAQMLQRILQGLSDDKPYVVMQGNLTASIETIFRNNNLQGVSVYYQNLLNAWSLVMDVLGIENESAQKRERMVVEEAVRNNSLAKCTGYDRLRARQIFAEQVSKKLGKNIRVSNAFTQLLDENDNNGNGIIDKQGGNTDGGSNNNSGIGYN